MTKTWLLEELAPGKKEWRTLRDRVFASRRDAEAVGKSMTMMGYKYRAVEYAPVKGTK